MVRAWLDNYKMGVKNSPLPGMHWRLIVTLGSETILAVYRTKEEYPDYVEIFCDMGVRGDNLEALNKFSEDEKIDLMLDIKMELARARIGYGGLTMTAETFHIFKRLPIQHNLTEFIFISTLGDIEAARNQVLVAFVRAQRIMEKRLSCLTALESDSYTPTLALPPTSS